mmetsp:Transcript_12077/g.50571  ORF Transcript_12077/g.50571 Transcript_12077/m.50571 type:complete len:241 (-) Transcript_12077:390-1112(-)
MTAFRARSYPRTRATRGNHSGGRPRGSQPGTRARCGRRAWRTRARRKHRRLVLFPWRERLRTNTAPRNREFRRSRSSRYTRRPTRTRLAGRAGGATASPPARSARSALLGLWPYETNARRPGSRARARPPGTLLESVRRPDAASCRARQPPRGRHPPSCDRTSRADCSRSRSCCARPASPRRCARSASPGARREACPPGTRGGPRVRRPREASPRGGTRVRASPPVNPSRILRFGRETVS